MNPDGLLLFNNQGYLREKYGLGARSIYKTLKSTGFSVQYFFEEENDGDGDLHFIVSLANIEFHTLQERRLNPCCLRHPHAYTDLIISE